MLDTGRFIAENTLKFSFSLVMTIVNSYGEEREQVIKKKRKQFLAEFDFEQLSRVKLIDSYPEEMVTDVLYLKKDGKTAWLKVYSAD